MSDSTCYDFYDIHESVSPDLIVTRGIQLTCVDLHIIPEIPTHTIPQRPSIQGPTQDRSLLSSTTTHNTITTSTARATGSSSSENLEHWAGQATVSVSRTLAAHPINLNANPRALHTEGLRHSDWCHIGNKCAP